MTGQDTGQRLTLDLIVVEDSPIDIELATDSLREAGLAASVRRVEDEHAFRAALDDQLPDAILSDWTLPHFSGRGALAIASERGVTFGVRKLCVLEIMPVSRAVAMYSSNTGSFDTSSSSKIISAVDEAVVSTNAICPNRSLAGE